VALSRLLDDIGNAVFCLNTIIVGLDAVERGHKKPASLNISWDPGDEKTAARKSRKFILDAVIPRAAGSFKSYIAAVASLPRFAQLAQSWHGSNNKSGSDPSIAEKVADLAGIIFSGGGGEGDENYLTISTILLLHWRNRITHKSSASLNKDQLKILMDSSIEISGKYCGLDVKQLVDDFESQSPSLKDVSSLIAMTINLARRFDRHIYQCNCADDVRAWISHYELDSKIAKVRGETTPAKFEDSVRRMFQTYAPQLEEPFFEFLFDPSSV